MRNLIVIVGLMGLLATACKKDKGNSEPYPDAVRDSFMEGCMEEAVKTMSPGDSNQMCACQLEAIENKVKLATFVKWSMAIEQKGEYPEEFVELVIPLTMKCMKKLGITVGGPDGEAKLEEVAEATKSGKYPDTVRDSFMEGCVEEGNKTFSATQSRQLCSCQLGGIESKVSMEKFLSWSLSIEQTGEIPQAFNDVIMPITLKCMGDLGLQ